MDKSFSDLLTRAVAGSNDAITEIIELYMPLINSHSRINGSIDEDCRQYIMTRVAFCIPKFVI